MIHLSYLCAILVSFVCMGLIDWKYSLALFYDSRRTFVTLAVGVGVFIVWDILGINLDIFFSGHSPYMSGWYIVPDFPVEELLFLVFLCYFTLIVYRFGEKKWQRT